MVLSAEQDQEIKRRFLAIEQVYIPSNLVSKHKIIIAELKVI